MRVLSLWLEELKTKHIGQKYFFPKDQAATVPQASLGGLDVSLANTEVLDLVSMILVAQKTRTPKPQT